MGQPVIVENKPGAGGNIATQGVMNGPADGYTLLFHSVAYAVNPTLFGNAGYDAVKDFTPIGQVGNAPSIMLVPNSSPAKTVKEWIEHARKNPGRLNYASSGNGTIVQLTAELFKSQADLAVVHVPYKGSGPALSELLGGQVDMVVVGVATSAHYFLVMCVIWRCQI